MAKKLEADDSAAARSEDHAMPHIDIVFDGPSGPESPRFIEVENDSGHSIRFGTWVDRGDGTWAIRITMETMEEALAASQA